MISRNTQLRNSHTIRRCVVFIWDRGSSHLSHLSMIHTQLPIGSPHWADFYFAPNLGIAISLSALSLSIASRAFPRSAGIRADVAFTVFELLLFSRLYGASSCAFRGIGISDSIYSTRSWVASAVSSDQLDSSKVSIISAIYHRMQYISCSAKSTIDICRAIVLSSHRDTTFIRTAMTSSRHHRLRQLDNRNSFRFKF